jgi:hypothetical protein
MRVGDNSSAEWRAEAQEKMEAWRRKSWEAIDAAKADCARVTGESATPGAWSGYSEAFLGCMRDRGWRRSGGNI